MRGEKITLSRTKPTTKGSPPLAWGKEGITVEQVDDEGITPTCVGKRHSWCAGWCRGWDHPHLRGEKGTIMSKDDGETGSPPLAWGKVFDKFLASKAIGITPTCVGKSSAIFSSHKLNQDHPHLRGEKTSSQSLSVGNSGSPPLAWGKDSSTTGGSPSVRITPTCVGKSEQSNLATLPKRDHPHLRGEKRGPYPRFAPHRGSPPLAWGKEYGGRGMNTQCGITPTCVGKSMPSANAVTTA